MKNITLEKITSQNALSMRKGLIEYSVMMICSNKSVYVGEIIDTLKNADMIVVEGTLYPLLSRLAKDGLLSYEWQESDSGPPRKYYKLTDDGLLVLVSYGNQWQQLKSAISKIDKSSKNKGTKK